MEAKQNEIRYCKDGKEGFSIHLGYTEYKCESFTQNMMRKKAQFMNLLRNEPDEYFVARKC
jgi:hypothetical protein